MSFLRFFSFQRTVGTHIWPITDKLVSSKWSNGVLHSSKEGRSGAFAWWKNFEYLRKPATFGKLADFLTLRLAWQGFELGSLVTEGPYYTRGTLCNTLKSPVRVTISSAKWETTMKLLKVSNNIPYLFLTADIQTESGVYEIFTCKEKSQKKMVNHDVSWICIADSSIGLNHQYTSQQPLYCLFILHLEEGFDGNHGNVQNFLFVVITAVFRPLVLNRVNMEDREGMEIKLH